MSYKYENQKLIVLSMSFWLLVMSSPPWLVVGILWILGTAAMAGVMFEDPRFHNFTKKHDVIMATAVCTVWPVTMFIFAMIRMFTKVNNNGH